MAVAKVQPLDFAQPAPLTQLLPQATPLLSSHQAGWKGFYFSHYRLSDHEIPEACLDQHLLSIFIGNAEPKLTVKGHFQNECFTQGDIGIIPAHQPTSKTWCHGEAEYLNLALEPELFTHLLHAVLPPVELVAHLKVRDPLIYQIGQALKTELETNRTGSPFYAESLVTALTAHLLRRYARQAPGLRTSTGGLPKSKLKAVIAYLHEHLDHPPSLRELAALVQLSPHYFATLFKQSTGLAPHQYLTQCRIEKAKQLLHQQNLSILDICLEVGFQSQSHFTKIFRKYTGVTPTVYRNTRS